MKRLRSPYDCIVRCALIALAAFALFASGQYSGHAQGVRDERIRQESVRVQRDDVAASHLGLSRVRGQCR